MHKNKTSINKKILIFVYLILSICFSAWIASKPTAQAISHNPQGEYCKYLAFKSDKPWKKQNSFIEKDGEFIPYNKLIHKNYKTFYIEYVGKNIHTANWQTSEGFPCRLTKKAIGMFSIVFLVVFLFMMLPIPWLIRNNKN